MNDTVLPSVAPFPELASETRMRDVLVVDDMSTIRLMLMQHIRQMGHRVTQASNGRQALDALAAQSFDLVLLDIQMPEMDGYQVLEAIKTDERLRDIPVVMISGVDEIESVVRCIERGAEDYLSKPFNPTILHARVRACLEKKRLWDELGDNFRRLQQSEKLRAGLTDMIVHDLRTPLTSMITGIETLDYLEVDDTQTRNEIINIVRDGSHTLLGMINDLLDVAKLEDGSMKLELEFVDPEHIMQVAAKSVTNLVKEKNLQFFINAMNPLPQLKCDSEKMRRVLVNLLGNAIKFTPSKGSVVLSCQNSADEQQGIVFEVHDSGTGVPESHFERIFEKFGQVEGRQGGQRASTGLGLTFCKMAVEAHGGRIWVESMLGQGSSFYCALPLVPLESASH